jgi:gliding motility-associated-like protein
LSSNNLNDIHAYTNGGTYTVTLTAVNTSCPSLTEKTTASFIIETLVPGIQYDTILAVNGKSFVINARSFGTNYLWQPPTGLSSATVRAPIANLSQNASYTVTIITAAGCVTTDAVYVKVATDGEIYVPGGFTPNGDGVNDRAYPILIGIRQLNYFKIFNRWGNLVFQTNDATPSNGWDGKFSGKMQMPGTFTWIAEAIDGHGNTIHRSGNIILIN